MKHKMLVARRPVKVIGDDAHEEEPAKEVSCCMVNYSPFASPAVLLPHHGVNNHFPLTVSFVSIL